MADGFPPLLQTSQFQDQYRLNNELPPELAAKQQALNRRQQLANLLLQRAGQTPQGQMAGRFYVAPSWAQGLANVAHGAAGYGASLANERERSGIAGESNNMLAQALQTYQQKTSPQSVELPGPGAPQPTGVEPGQGFSPEELAAPGATRPTMRDEIADLHAKRSGAFFQEGARPTAEVPASPEQRKQALVELIANQHPQAQQLGKLLSQQEFMKSERDTNREFQATEGQLNRDARLQGQEIQLNQAMMMGLITKEQKDQMLALQKQQIEQTGALKRMELDTKKELLQQGKTPPGYRPTEGGLEAIPGGPADLKQQGKRDQATASLQSMTSDLDRLAVSANQILNHPGLAGITGLRGSIPDIPGTQAADARALLNKLKSQVGFSVLQNMRNNSKTGGALGNVSDNEGKRLENNLASVESAQSIDQMKQELQGIIEYVNGSKSRLQAAYDSTYGDTPAPRASSTMPPSKSAESVAPFNDAEKERRYQEWKKSHK